MNLPVIAHHAARRIPALLEHGLDALTLATFPVEWLDALTAAYYHRVAVYHSDVHNAHGLFPGEKEAIDAHFPRAATVLVTSAGGGREVLALLESGRRVVACECVPSLVEEMRRRVGDRASIYCCAPDELPPGRFDAAVIGWGAYSHLPGQARRLELLRRITRALPSHAPVVMSFWGTDRGHSRSLRAVARAANLLPFRARPVEVGDTTRLGYFIHLFEPGEVADEARAAGLIDAREELLSIPLPYLIGRTP